MDAASLVIQPVGPADVLPLRQAILRPHQTVAECATAPDRDPRALHVGAFAGEELIGVVTIVPDPGPQQAPQADWRLRGMAVAQEWQGQGAGQRLMAEALRFMRERGDTGILWCNARITARGFYDRLGWQAVGEVFDLPGIGPHVVMVYALR